MHVVTGIAQDIWPSRRLNMCPCGSATGPFTGYRRAAAVDRDGLSVHSALN